MNRFFIDITSFFYQYKVTNSYYMKMGNFANEFFTNLSDKVETQKKKKEVIDKIAVAEVKQLKLKHRRQQFLNSFEYMEEVLSIPEEKSFEKTTVGNYLLLTIFILLYQL